MNRRQLLLVSASTALGAGCFGQEETPKSSSLSPTSDSAATSHGSSETERTRSPSCPSRSPELADSTFKEVKRDDRKSPDWATVSFTEGDRRYFVTIDGSLDGEDTSKEPTLQNAEYVADRETLYVDVGTKTAEGADAGGEMIVELDYHAEFDFCTALPPTVRVIHKTGPPVTVARRNC